MDQPPFVSIPTVSVIILLAALTAILILFLMWSIRVNLIILSTKTNLTHLRSRIEQLVLVLHEVIFLKKPPYLDIIQELMECLRTADRLWLIVESLFDNLNHRVKNKHKSPIKQVFIAFFNAHKNYLLAKQLRSEQIKLENSLEESEKILESLRRLPEEIHSKVTQALITVDDFKTTIAKLREGGVCGENVSQAANALHQIIQLRQELPDEMISSVLPQDGVEIRAKVIKAYEFLQRIEPLVNEWLEQAHLWLENYQDARDTYQRLEKRLEELQAALENHPSGLIISEFTEVVERLDQQRKNLLPRLSKPHVDELIGLCLEAELMNQNVFETKQRYDVLVASLRRLNQLVFEIQDMHKQSEKLMKDQKREKVYPIQWKESISLWNNLAEKMQDLGIGNPEVSRTPAQVNQDLIITKHLLEETAQFLKAVNQKISMHNELKSVLQNPYITKGITELESVKRFINKNRENKRDLLSFFPTKEMPDEISEICDQILHLQVKVVRGDLSEQLPEKELPDRLDEARNLLSLYEKMKSLLQQWLKTLYEQLSTKVEGLKEILSQLDSVVIIQGGSVQEARNFTNRLKTKNFIVTNSINFEDLVEMLANVMDNLRQAENYADILEDIHRNLHPYNQKVQERQEAVKVLFNQLKEWESEAGKRPNRRSFKSLIESCESLFDRYENNRTGYDSPEQAIKSFDDLSDAFQELEQKIRHALEEAERERQGVLQLENEIEDLARRWEYWRGSLNQESRQRLEEMVNQSRRRVSRLREEYQAAFYSIWFNREESYNSLLRNLDEVRQQLKNARFTSEDGREIMID